MVVYCLRDPSNKEIRYVGIAANYKKRLIGHIACAKNGRLKHRESYRPTHCENWIRSLLARGMRPTIEVVEEVNQPNWAERERYWISEYRRIGLRLTNLTDGGEGTYGHKQSAEVRAKHGLAVRLACTDPKVIKRKSLGAMGHFVSEETRRKIGDKASKRKVSDESKVERSVRMKAIIQDIKNACIILKCVYCKVKFKKRNILQKYCSNRCCQTVARNKFRALWGRGKAGNVKPVENITDSLK